MSTRSAITDIHVMVKGTIKHQLDDGWVTSVNVGGWVLRDRLQNGIEEDQANRGWQYDGTIASGDTLDIDLHDFAGLDMGGGAGRDGLGQVMDLEEVTALIIHHDSGAGSLEVNPTDPAGVVTWVSSMTVAKGNALESGGCVLFYQPDEDSLDLTDAVSHVIRLGANGGDVDYRVFVSGRHDDNESSSTSTSTSTSTTTTSSTQSMSSSSSSSTSTQSASSLSSSSSSSSATVSTQSSSSSSSSLTSASSQSSSSSSSSSSSVSESSSSSSCSSPSTVSGQSSTSCSTSLSSWSSSSVTNSTSSTTSVSTSSSSTSSVTNSSTSTETGISSSSSSTQGETTSSTCSTSFSFTWSNTTIEMSSSSSTSCTS